MGDEDSSVFQKWLYRSLLWFNLLAITLFILHKLRNKFYCWFYSIVTPMAHKAIRKNKENLFLHLKNLKESSLQSDHIRVLEFGVGMGNNFDMYPENTWLTVVEPFTAIRPLFEDNLKKADNVKLEQILPIGAENMSDIEDESFDAVVCTFTLCSVNNVKKVLDEVERILRPGGMFLFIEHVKSANPIIKTVQYLWQPFHYVIAHGCILVRQPHLQLDTSKFELTVCNEWDLEKSKFPLVKSHVEVLAVKSIK